MHQRTIGLSSLLIGLAAAASVSLAGESYVIEQWSRVDIPQLEKMQKLFGGKNEDGTTSLNAYSADGQRMGEKLKKGRKVTALDLEGIFTIRKDKCVEVVSLRELRMQWEAMGGQSPFGTGQSEAPREGDETDPTYKVEITTKELDPQQVAGIESERIQTDVTVHEEGLTVEEGGGVTVTAVTCHGNSEAVRAKETFEKNMATAVGEALQFGQFRQQLKDAFLQNPAIEQAMKESEVAGPSPDSSLLAANTKILSYPDPRAKKKEGDSSAGSADDSPSGLAGKVVGGLFGKKSSASGSADPKPMTIEHRVLKAEPGGSELLAIPDDCQTKLEKKHEQLEKRQG